MRLKRHSQILTLLTVCAIILSFVGTQTTSVKARPTGRTFEKVAPLIADYRTTRVKVGASGSEKETTYGRMYRDAQGRTRKEEGALVTISDPVAQATYLINTQTKLFLKRDWSPSSKAGAGVNNATATIKSALVSQKSLGSRYIGNFQATGEEVVYATQTKGADGGIRPVEMSSQVWASDELAFALRISTKDSLGNDETIEYANVQRNPNLDPGLFQSPQDYTSSVSVNEVVANSGGGCTLFIFKTADQISIPVSGPQAVGMFIDASKDASTGFDCFISDIFVGEASPAGMTEIANELDRGRTSWEVPANVPRSRAGTRSTISARFINSSEQAFTGSIVIFYTAAQ